MTTQRRSTLHQTLIGILLVSVFVCCKKPEPVITQAGTMSELYGLKKVPRFDLTIGPKGMQALADKPREWTKADFRYGTQQLPSVRVRIKGHRSLRRIDQKASFKVRFDKGKKNKNRTMLGVRRLTLNNLVEDPTMIREYLGYRLAREVGLPVPKAGFAQVFVNDEYYGLYLVLETPDKDFLQRQFGSGQGQLYEGEYGCDLFPEDVDGFDLDLGDDSKRDALRRFAEAAKGTGEALWTGPDAPVQIEHLTKFLAFAHYVGDFDGYHHSHNYRLYHSPNDSKWYLMSWGLDRAFFKKLTPFSSKGLLAKRCFGNETCRVEYLKALRKIDEAAKSLNLVLGSKVIASIIADAVNQDSKRPYNAKRIDKLRAKLRNFLTTRSADIARETGCLDSQGKQQDLDGDGYSCMDCDDLQADNHPGAVERCDGVDNNCSGLVDDSPQCGCPTETLEGQRLAFCDLPMPWEEAQLYCESLGGKLAMPVHESFRVAIYRKAKSINANRWWLGAHDRNLEGHYEWLSGDSVAPEVWAKGEPDNGHCNQDCVALRKGAGSRLHDTHCGQHNPFVCELPTLSPRKE